MNKGNLKKVVKNFVKEKTLSDTQLESLMQLQQTVIVKEKKKASMRLRWISISVAATLIVIMGNLYHFTSMNSGLALDQRIGSEVAKNHIKLKPLEIQTSSMDKIRRFFTELDFSPVESVLLKGSSKQLIGARYCSIQGVTAAQLRLKDSKTGQVQSLYQTLYDKKVFYDLPLLKENQKPITVYSKGLAVEIWVEKGILFALTKESTKD